MNAPVKCKQARFEISALRSCQIVDFPYKRLRRRLVSILAQLYEVRRFYLAATSVFSTAGLICIIVFIYALVNCMTGELTEMAISSYLGWLLLLIVVYPFLLVGVSMYFYDIQRKKAQRWLSGVSLILAVFLFYMHMQTEIIYGRELLEAWYKAHPQDRP